MKPFQIQKKIVNLTTYFKIIRKLNQEDPLSILLVVNVLYSSSH